MSSSRFAVVLASVALVSLGVACSSSSDVSDDVEDGTEDALSSAGRALVGSYVGAPGSKVAGIALTPAAVGSRNRFFADVDTGIQCVTTPCPTSARIDGTFSAGTRTITFRSETASDEVKSLLGRYRYELRGDALTLRRGDAEITLTKAPSYCAAPADCDRQGLAQPRCLGAWKCAAKACSYECGANRCSVLDEVQCRATDGCKPKYGPSHCSEDGRVCTRDLVFKGCDEAPPVDPPVDPPGATPCGATTCGAGTVCCNASCGICTPPGSACIQIECL